MSSLSVILGEARVAGNRKSAALREVERLAAKPDETPMELARALAALEDEAPGSIVGLVESTGISPRKLYYHLAIGQTLGQMGLPPKQLAAIGWAKLSIIAQHFKNGEEGKKRDAHVRQALAHAENYTMKELPSILKGEPLPKAKPHSIHLRLTPKQYKVFETALQRESGEAEGSSTRSAL